MQNEPPFTSAQRVDGTSPPPSPPPSNIPNTDRAISSAAPLPAASFSGTPLTPPSLAPRPTVAPVKKKPLLSRVWFRFGLGALVLILILGTVSLLSRPSSQATQPKPSDFKNVNLSLGQFASTSTAGADSLQVNGRLQVSGSLLLAPRSRPSQAALGQLYFDADSKRLAYYNGQDFVTVGGESNSSSSSPNTTIITNGGTTGPAAVQLQNATPGTIQAGNFNIGGVGSVGTLKTSVIDSAGAGLFINPTATTASSQQPSGTTATLGSSTPGSSTLGPGWNNVLSATKVSMGDSGGTIKSISVKFVGGSSSSHVQLAIYDDDGDIPSHPGSLLANSAVGALVPNGTTTLTVPSIGLSAGSTYWLAVNTDDTTVARPYNGGNKVSCFVSSGFGFMPDPFSTFGCFFDNNAYTIYATYQTSTGSPGSVSKAEFSLSPTGQALFQNAEDSGTGFQIQNAAGSSTIFNVDTVTGRIAIGKAAAAYKLDIAGGDINLSNNRSIRFGGVQTLSVNGSGSTTSVSNFLSGGTVSAQADNFVVQDANATHRSLAIDTNGAAIFSNRVNSATAFQIQNSAGASFFIADSSQMKISVAGTNTSFASLNLSNAHLSSTQTTAPTISSPTACATGPTAAITPGSTDTAGSFTITTGTGGTSSTCDSTISFHTSYGAAPKSILVVGKDSAAAASRQVYVSAASSTSFTVSFANTSGEIDSTPYNFSYWVIE